MKKLPLALTCFLLTLGSAAQADVTVLSNLPSNNLGSGNVDNTEQRAITFTTAGSPLTVTEVQLSLQNYISLTDTALLSIHSNGTNQPGSQIGATFTAPTSNSDNPGVFSFTSDGVALSADTTYWVVIKGGSSEGFSWNRSNPTVTPTSTAYGSFGNQWITQNTGGTWEVGSNGAHSFAIIATVPEPGTTGLVAAAGLLGVIFHRRRRG